VKIWSKSLVHYSVCSFALGCGLARFLQNCVSYLYKAPIFKHLEAFAFLRLVLSD
jgi:hypothetical protein